MLCLAGCLAAFKFAVDKGSAQVHQRDGLYIFMLSKPTAEYESLGSLKKRLNSGPEVMLNSMIEQANKKFPQCEGIIFTSVDMDNVECIKFK